MSAIVKTYCPFCQSDAEHVAAKVFVYGTVANPTVSTRCPSCYMYREQEIEPIEAARIVVGGGVVCYNPGEKRSELDLDIQCAAFATELDELFGVSEE